MRIFISILRICFLLTTAFVSNAQDIIYTNYGSTIRTKIISNTDSIVTFYTKGTIYGSFYYGYSEMKSTNEISYIPKKYITKIKFADKSVVNFNNPMDSLKYTLTDTVVSTKNQLLLSGQPVSFYMLQKLSKSFPKAKKQYNGAGVTQTVAFTFAYVGGLITGFALVANLYKPTPEGLTVLGTSLAIAGISLPFAYLADRHIKKGNKYYNDEVKTRASLSSK